MCFFALYGFCFIRIFLNVSTPRFTAQKAGEFQKHYHSKGKHLNIWRLPVCGDSRTLFPPPHRALDLAILDFFLNILPAVVEFFAFGQGEFTFGDSFFKVELCRDKGEAAFFHLANQTLDLVLVEEELSGTQGFVVELIGGGIVRNMGVEKDKLVATMHDMAVVDIGMAFTQGFNFAPDKHETGLELFQDFITKSGLAVGADNFLRRWFLAHSGLRRLPSTKTAAISRGVTWETSHEGSSVALISLGTRIAIRSASLPTSSEPIFLSNPKAQAPS